MEKDILEDDDSLQHYGMPFRSGRYPWGSGENPFQRTGNFFSRREVLKSQGLNETQIAKAMDMSTTEYRAMKAIALEEATQFTINKCKALKQDGLSNAEIARRLNLKGESTVRSFLNQDIEARRYGAMKTAENLKKIVSEQGMIDVGKATELQLNVSREKLSTALAILEEEGYTVRNIRIPQLTNPNAATNMKVLCPPGTEYKDVYANKDKIGSVEDYTTRDNGNTLEPSYRPPSSISSSRVQIRYSEDGGEKKDGVIEIRRGVDDLSLGDSTYAQVRILVDGNRYLKGMCVYTDGKDMEPGKDILFNTNKHQGTPMEDVLKKIKDDPDNPFGANISKQIYYDDPKGKYVDPVTGHKQSLSPINMTKEEGDVTDWSDTLASQFLSKQNKPLIKKQLDLTYEDKVKQFDEIMSLTNPVVKRNMLNDFAENIDSDTLFLKAKAFSGQKYKLLLPVNSLKDTEVYAPHLKDGTEVALVRYPHGGLFEIPKLIVNNRNAEGKEIMGTTPNDAIGINANVAKILSGADFDGDTAMVIPITSKSYVTNKPPLPGLKDFDPKFEYEGKLVSEVGNVKIYDRNGHKFKGMLETTKQKEMGVVSNLITDMTLAGATNEELERAVKHSMVVIDAVKHGLDYRKSEIDNNISELKAKYQKHIDPKTGELKEGGASTIISRAKNEVEVNERKDGIPYAMDTGNKLISYDTSKNLYIDPSNGKTYDMNKRGQIKTVKVDPETGEKLYHDTNRVYAKVEAKDPKTGRVSTFNLYAQDKDGKKTQPGFIDINDPDNESKIKINKDAVLYYKTDPKSKDYKIVTDEKVNLYKATQKSHQMEETTDARSLSSGTPKEELYAEYANKLKALANTARKEALAVKDTPYSPSAKVTYRREVDSLNQKLTLSELNAPRERKAQALADVMFKSKPEVINKTLDKEHEKRLRQQTLTKAREMVGAKRIEIDITPKEWEAIQAGAISTTKLQKILLKADGSKVRQYALPRQKASVSESKINRINAMAKSGKTTAEIADTLGISIATVNNYLNK